MMMGDKGESERQEEKQEGKDTSQVRPVDKNILPLLLRFCYNYHH